MNLLNIHTGIFQLLNQIHGVFIPIFLYEENLPIYQIFLVLAAINLLRIPLRLLVFPLIHAIGLKALLLVSALGSALSISLLAFVDHINIWLFIFIVIFSFFSAVYWTCFHVFYAILGESEHRGKHIAVKKSLMFILAAFFPLISAVTIKYADFHSYFLLAIPVAILSIIPLLGCASHTIKKVKYSDARADLFCFGTKRSIFQSFYIAVYLCAWVIIVFSAVGDIMSFGWIIAFGVIAQVVFQLFLGHWVDKGRMGKVMTTGSVILSLVICLRAFLAVTIPVILLLEVLQSISVMHIDTASEVAIYNDSQQSDHVLWYWFFSELGWDIGSVGGFFLIAFLVYMGMDLQLVMLFSLVGVYFLWKIIQVYNAGRLKQF